jgi:tryptophan synthase beta chain
MIHDFQAIVSQEIAVQLNEVEGRLPDYVMACVGGGSNAIGAFAEFLPHRSVQLVGVEAGGVGNEPGKHARRFLNGSTGIVEGYKSIFLQNDDGQLQPTHSISAGLDYPGIGPELAYLQQQKRVTFTYARDAEVIDAFDLVAKTEGILPALESSHALAYAIKLAPTLPKDKIIVVNISGRGDKDLFILAGAFKDMSFYTFLKSEVDRNGQ